MSRIRDAFQNGKAFIAFVTGGYPDFETTGKLVQAMADAGADVIEIGIPFSDPIAEGPVIEKASAQALSSGFTVDRLFELMARLRQTVTVPIVFMTYANPVLAYGTERFLTRCQAVGVDGLIIPDTPYEEREEFGGACKAHGVDLISMVAPTSAARASEIAKQAEGFLYCVSSLGVTGVRQKIGTDIFRVIETVKQCSSVPCAIGFGVSTPEQAKEMAAHADGVIVGSAIVKLVAQYGVGSIPYVADYVRQMKMAVSAAV